MSVIVILPDNKRLTIKATSNTLVSEILEKVCTHKALDSNNHTLRRNNRPLDLYLTLRLASIPLNSELSLVKDENKSFSLVDLSVQLEDKQRRTGKFNPSQTLWQVIENLFLQDFPEIVNEETILSINFMNRQFEGQETLKKTTLKLMGLLSGRVVLRLNTRTKESLKTQKFVENIQFKKPASLDPKKTVESSPVEAAPPPSLPLSKVDDNNSKLIKKTNETIEKQPTPSDDTVRASSTVSQDDVSGNQTEPLDLQTNKRVFQKKSIFDEFKNLKKTVKTSNSSVANGSSKSENHRSIDMPEIDLQKEVKYLGGKNNEILYSIEDSPQFEEENLSEDFFDLTSSDLRHLLTELRRQQAGETANELQVRSTREERAKVEKEKFDQTILRILFPYDRLILQAFFQPTDTISGVINVIKQYIKSVDIYLFTAPPKNILSNDLKLIDLKLVPNGLIYCGCVDTSFQSKSFIKEQFKGQITPYLAASQLATKQMKIIFNKSKQIST